MSITAWQEGIRGINNGESVDAATTNRPISDVNDKANYLKDLLDALHNGEALLLRNRAVAEECYDGCAVYHDAENFRFAPALAHVQFDSGVSTISASSFVVGVIAKKLSATVADIIIGGTWKYSDTSAIVNKDQSGPRYLSATEGGLLVDEPPAFAVRVGQWLAESGEFLVNPVNRDTLENHVHYRFKLFSEPAGIPAPDVYMNKQSITTANTALPGWLPADDPIFQGLAPEGAKFGYNLGMHPELFKVFPPVPLDNAYIEAYIDGAGAGRELDEIVKIDQSGIWWMTDDWGWAPWASDIATLDDNSSSVTDPTEKPPPIELQHGHGYVGTNPAQQYRFSIYLWFSRPTYRTDNDVVASLQPAKGSPITVEDCEGKGASTGHLYLGLDLNLLDDGKDYPGSMVVKEFSKTAIKRGTVVERIKSDSSLIQLVAQDGQQPDEQGFLGGRILLKYNDPNSQKRDFEAALFALDGAAEVKQFDIFYIGLKPGTTNSVRGRIDIPTLGMPTGKFNVKLHTRFFLEKAGALPALKFTYRRVPAAAVPTALPNNGAEVVLANIDLGAVATTQFANMYFDVQSADMETQAGDSLFFTIQRQSDSYDGIVGVVRARGVIA